MGFGDALDGGSGVELWGGRHGRRRAERFGAEVMRDKQLRFPVHNNASKLLVNGVVLLCWRLTGDVDRGPTRQEQVRATPLCGCAPVVAKDGRPSFSYYLCYGLAWHICIRSFRPPYNLHTHFFCIAPSCNP